VVRGRRRRVAKRSSSPEFLVYENIISREANHALNYVAVGIVLRHAEDGVIVGEGGECGEWGGGGGGGGDG